MLKTQRQQLSNFLRTCRARIQPEDVGIPSTPRRRTPGLRREDVAKIAGVSATWYTWLEQGRDIRVSEEVLLRVSEALRLSSDERGFLFSLVQGRPAPASGNARPVIVDAITQRMIDHVGVPAIVINERWDVLAWNEHTVSFIRDYEKIPAAHRNLMRILILNEDSPLAEDDYDVMARRIIPKFRIDFSRSQDSDSFSDLIAELRERSALFNALWSRPEVVMNASGINEVSHPELGGMTFEHSFYIPEGNPALRIVLYLPAGEDSEVLLHKVTGTRRPEF